MPASPSSACPSLSGFYRGQAALSIWEADQAGPKGGRAGTGCHARPLRIGLLRPCRIGRIRATTRIGDFQTVQGDFAAVTFPAEIYLIH